MGPRLLLRTNRKSHTRFRLVPTSMTLDDLERLKSHSCRNKQHLWAHQKKLNEDKPILSAAECSLVIAVSKSVRPICRYSRGFLGRGVNCRTTVMHGLRPSILRCAFSYLRLRTYVSYSHASWPFSSIIDSSLFFWSTGRCRESGFEWKMKRLIF